MSYVATATAGGPVISLMGDGGLGMTMSEISTVVEHGIHTVAVVMNNTYWGAEKAYQCDFFNGRCIGANVSSRALWRTQLSRRHIGSDGRGYRGRLGLRQTGHC